MAVIHPEPVRAKPSVDTEVLFSIHPELLNDAYIYVHAHVHHTNQELLIRIWQTTFLYDRISGSKAELIHAENISFAPTWTIVPRNFNYTFLLIFGSLPKSCTVFDLVEEISQPGNFYVPEIVRNDADIYHIDLSL